VDAWPQVPERIPRPEYVGRTGPEADGGPDVKDADTLERMREVCRIAAQALQAGGEAARPGMTTRQVDDVILEFFLDHDTYPSDLGYMGFPRANCTSLNEVICHGIPDDTVIQEGDILNLDVTGYKNGVHGDCNATFLMGDVDDELRTLVEVTHEATMRGIRAAKPGREVNVIGRVIEKYAARHGYESVRDYTGHGIGRGFHTGLIIPHYDSAPQYDTEIQVGMVFTVEPMLTLGSQEWEQWDDDWTVVTRDRSFTAQFEHTILVTEDGPEILTLP
jgi:methionyl aminopeptidase